MLGFGGLRDVGVFRDVGLIKDEGFRTFGFRFEGFRGLGFRSQRSRDVFYRQNGLPLLRDLISHQLNAAQQQAAMSEPHQHTSRAWDHRCPPMEELQLALTPANAVLQELVQRTMATSQPQPDSTHNHNEVICIDSQEGIDNSLLQQTPAQTAPPPPATQRRNLWRFLVLAGCYNVVLLGPGLCIELGLGSLNPKPQNLNLKTVPTGI